MTAAPSELHVEGVTYRVSPLRDRDFGEFERWVQDRYLDVALRNLAGITDDRDRETILKAAYEKAAHITASSPEAIQLMVTVDGAAKLLWLSLRREHSDITFEQAADLATHPQTVKMFMDKIRDINKVETAATTKGDKKKRSAARKSIGFWRKSIISLRGRLRT